MKKYYELTYEELYSLDEKGIKEVYRDHNLSKDTVEWTLKLFRDIKESKK